tara:strand:- start:158 stop:307 length:150 start_codon:yes stop_codon:yes gene_type:complete
MSRNIKKDWIEPVIKELGEAKDLIKGGAPGEDPKTFGAGDQFAVNDLTT